MPEPCASSCFATPAALFKTEDVWPLCHLRRLPHSVCWLVSLGHILVILSIFQILAFVLVICHQGSLVRALQKDLRLAAGSGDGQHPLAIRLLSVKARMLFLDITPVHTYQAARYCEHHHFTNGKNKTRV